MIRDFSPVKVKVEYSSLMSIVYLIFADFRGCKISKTIREKFVDLINVSWNDY